MKNRPITSALIAVICLLATVPAKAQHFAIQTNAMQWANLGTVNAAAGISLSRHFSVEAGFRYNPFTFRKSSRLTIKNQQTSAYTGIRYWPWYVFSGWWISGRGQWEKFSDTGLWRYALNEGSRAGIVLSAGYTWMINKKINIEFGIGGWGGRYIDHTLYHCPSCMEIRESRLGGFIALDDLSVSFVYIF